MPDPHAAGNYGRRDGLRNKTIMEPIRAVDVKVFATKGDAIDPYEFMGVLQRWIRDHTIPGILIDVADYSHIPQGNGIVLVGHEANVNVDYAGGRMGVLYRYKWPAEPDTAGRIEAAVKSALDAAQKLENEPEFKGRLEFDKTAVEIISNDRLRAPNTDEAAAGFSAAVEKAVSRVLSGAKVVRVSGDARERLAVTAG